MKILFFSLAIISYSAIKAQPCNGTFLGTKTLYVSGTHTTPAPNGYAPVFIQHAGRHGARHLTKEVNTYYTYDILKTADSVKGLTTAGESLWKMVWQLDKIEKKNVKSVSERGKKEQLGIGERMLANNAPVFTGKPMMEAVVTKEIRTTQTADAFLCGLKISGVEKTLNDTILRFYDLSPAYLAYKNGGEWEKVLNEYSEQQHYVQLADTLTDHLFTPAFIKSHTIERKKVLADISGFATIVYSLQDEIATAGLPSGALSFDTFFNCNQLKRIGDVDNMDEYLAKGPALDLNGIQVTIAVPLLIDFIRSADNYIEKEEHGARLRFCHAETISPIASLMGLEGTSATMTKPGELNKVWDAAKVIPLSANIQWVFYHKPGSTKWLVKFMLNEKEVHVDKLNTTSFPYYDWKDVRVHYMNKLQTLHASIDTDLMQYLRELKE